MGKKGWRQEERISCSWKEWGDGGKGKGKEKEVVAGVRGKGVKETLGFIGGEEEWEEDEICGRENMENGGSGPWLIWE